MTEYRLILGDPPYVSTLDYHRDRPRVPHLEQEEHRPRLLRAAEFVHQAAESCGGASVSDLGCGDGGLLSLVQAGDYVLGAWGYDFSPANAAGWSERGVTARQRDVFNPDHWCSDIEIGTVVVMTEVLEHLADPHGVLATLQSRGAARLVVSSPADERPGSASDCHAWAWDTEGYAKMITEAGWKIVRHERVGSFQVVLAE